MNIHPLECTDAGWFSATPAVPTLGAERWAIHIRRD